MSQPSVTGSHCTVWPTTNRAATQVGAAFNRCVTTANLRCGRGRAGEASRQNLLPWPKGERSSMAYCDGGSALFRARGRDRCRAWRRAVVARLDLESLGHRDPCRPTVGIRFAIPCGIYRSSRIRAYGQRVARSAVTSSGRRATKAPRTYEGHGHSHGDRRSTAAALEVDCPGT
jgi:hypothetical protein